MLFGAILKFGTVVWRILSARGFVVEAPLDSASGTEADELSSSTAVPLVGALGLLFAIPVLVR